MTRYAEDFNEDDPCPMAVEGSDNVKCPGTLYFPPAENCSCHLRAPCGSCTDRSLECKTCGWEVEDVEL